MRQRSDGGASVAMLCSTSPDQPSLCVRDGETPSIRHSVFEGDEGETRDDLHNQRCCRREWQPAQQEDGGTLEERGHRPQRDVILDASIDELAPVIGAEKEATRPAKAV